MTDSEDPTNPPDFEDNFKQVLKTNSQDQIAFCLLTFATMIIYKVVSYKLLRSDYNKMHLSIKFVMVSNLIIIELRAIVNLCALIWIETT